MTSVPTANGREPIEIVGLVAPYRGSEISTDPNPYDPSAVAEWAKLYEQSGYDRVLIGQNARSADSLVTASWVAAATSKLKMMIAHRPGFIAPTMAARALATLDAFSGGRVGVHIITAFSDIETQCDGDFLTKDDRYHRSREYVQVLQKMWSASEPFDHDGDVYKFNQAFSEVRPSQETIPIFWAGMSQFGLQYGSQLADVYAIGPGSLAQVAEQCKKIKTEAAKHGRNPRISMSMRLVVGESDEAARARADDMLKIVEEKQRSQGLLGRDLGKAAEALVKMAKEAENEDTDPQLWTGLTQATQGRLQVMCLVGSPDTLAGALQHYHQAGIDNFLITGFDWASDTACIGTEIGPKLRELCEKANMI